MANKSAVLYGIDDLRIEDRIIPQPGPGQVQVMVEVVGVCGSDIHYYREGRINDMVVEAPMILGHEASGTITAVGEGIPETRVGELVALEPGIPCKTCVECRSGRYNLCPDVKFFATPPVDGAFTQYVVLDADYAFSAPGLSALQAAMCEPVSVAVAACRKTLVEPGKRVLVLGAGPIGLLCAQVARAYGATNIEVNDISSERIAAAQHLGFATGGQLEEADVILECSGSQKALDTAFCRAARNCRILLIGMGADTVSFDLGLLQSREIWISGTFRYANTYPTAIELISSGKIDVDSIVTGAFPLDRAEEALAEPSRNPEALKVVVTP